MRKCLKSAAAILATGLFIFGCSATGENIKANVYKEGQVNKAQDAKTVNIIAIMPAKIEVNNEEGQKNAQIVGGLLGAVAGGAAGNAIGHNTKGTVAGTAAGGVAGVAAGALVPEKVLVDGVSLTYVDDKNKTMNSAQVGKLCEYKTGPAIVIATNANETRIQPNATCPTKE